MGIIKTLQKLRAGYPGGWKKYARGTQGDRTPPFVQPSDPDDRRSQIPPLGLREYWYPALPAKAVGWKKPVGLRMLGTDLVFFRDKNGQVRALWDYCPHRGAYLSWGDCFWKGYVSCPYHGATFDGAGECVEFITEGPDSKMVGRMKARVYPTQTLKGIVFVWMGEGEPVPIEEDVPPEFFDEKALVQTAWNYWPMNWIIALENTYDAHNAFLVHRNSIRMLMSRLGGRPRTPLGFRIKVVDNKAVNAIHGATELYYAREGTIPYQMYYPRVGGYWPLHRWRLLWTWFTDRRRYASQQTINPPEWGGTFGQRLPSMRRQALSGKLISTRWCVPVEENLTRLFFVSASWPSSGVSRVWKQIRWPLDNWLSNFNFQNQDRDVAVSVRYQYPEYLSPTDSYMVAFRKLVTEHGRGVGRAPTLPEETRAEKLMREGYALLGAVVGPTSEVQEEPTTTTPGVGS